MQILFIISILCFFVLLWAGVAIARHIRAGHKRDSAQVSSQRSFAQHLYHFAAAEDGGVPSTRAADLTDPYQSRRLRANSGARATSPKRF